MSVDEPIVTTTEFSEIPICLRRYAFEIYSVVEGIRVSGHLDIAADQLASTITFFESTGLFFYISTHQNNERFLQAAPDTRKQMQRKNLIRVYYSKRRDVASDLARSDIQGTASNDVGTLLGYPECCVQFAGENDKIWRDPLFRTKRQTNLVSICIDTSASASHLCNILLSECELSALSPMSFIAHYPCSLDCQESQDAALQISNMASELWPIWLIRLNSLLRSPIVYWRDTSWPPNYWTEFIGMCFPFGALVGGNRVESRPSGDSINLGASRLPSGPLEAGATAIEIGTRGTQVEYRHRQTIAHSHQAAGAPVIVEWDKHKIHHFVAESTQWDGETSSGVIECQLNDQ